MEHHLCTYCEEVIVTCHHKGDRCFCSIQCVLDAKSDERSIHHPSAVERILELIALSGTDEEPYGLREAIAATEQPVMF